MKNLSRCFACLVLFGPAGAAQAQIPTKCFEIESILVDACISATECPGSQEGQNEMVRFRIGPDPIALSGITVAWPNNPWRGFVQDASTAALVATLNASIESCGWLVEPPAGIIPAGAGVLLVTSTAMCVPANSFTNLGDTLYLVFQQPGNTAGHFANHTNGSTISPTPSSAPTFRTLVMTHQPTNCGDTATYDRSLLTNVFGTYGGNAADNDGATAVFTWPGVPQVSYVNIGCQAPFDPVTVSVVVTGDLCGGQVQLEGVLSGAFDAVAWSGGSGTFSDANGLLTTYSPGPADQGSVDLTFCATGSCADPVCATVTLPVGDAPVVLIAADGPLQLCPGETLTLTASGAGSYLWSTGSTADAIVVAQAGTFSVTGTTACGSAEASVEVVPGALPEVDITSSGALCPEAVLTASGAQDYVWSTGETTAAITVGSPGTYSVTGSNACGADTGTITVEGSGVTAGFQANVVVGDAPLLVQFTNFAQPPTATFAWDFGDGTGSTATAPDHLFTQPGTYTVTLTATDGDCSATGSLVITVLAAPIEPSSVRVPNVFSPNGDGMNDSFEVITTGIARMEMHILNRWGQEVATLKQVHQKWDGRTAAGEPLSEGTYFYVLDAEGADGKRYDLTGTITLLR